MKGRRAFLKSVTGALLAAPAAGVAAFSAAAGTAPDLMAGTAGIGTTGIGKAGAGFLATRHGAYFLVDGWVLTAADLATLGIELPQSGSLGPGSLGPGNLGTMPA